MMKKLLFVCLCFLSTINAGAQSFVFPMGFVFPFFDLNIDVKSNKVYFRIASYFDKYPYNNIIKKETFFKSYIITELEHGVLNEKVCIRMILKETKSGKLLGTVLYLYEYENGTTSVRWFVKEMDKENFQASDYAIFETPSGGVGEDGPRSVQEFKKLLKYVKTHPIGDSSSQSKTTPSQTQPKTTTSRAYISCPDNNHPHVIDLGLPSGTKWACCNVDAKKPEDYGGYYAWGETSTKTEYSSSNYRYEGVNIGSDIRGTQYDVAHVKWGGKWQMPTQEQIKELDDNCKYEWTTLNGVKGGKFTGPNGKSIFIPAAGYRSNGDLYIAGSYGNYWSSTQYPDYSYYAYDLDFYSGLASWYYFDRFYGQSVRPVVRN